jgi:mono/diheme cytochrome c family protein
VAAKGKFMRITARLLEFFTAGLLGLAIGAALIFFLIMPRMRWGASTRPSAAETWAARYVLSKWVRMNASSESNPLPPTSENLRDGEREYNEHCAVCHGIGGNGENRLGADFYPPIARLSEGLVELPDGQLYFIVSNGIRMSGMPGFGTRHTANELWKMILWVRHLPNLTSQERTAIQARLNAEIGDKGH